ncbi:MAG: 16S rRNA processing protein RimM [Deltaproteobacteria bacterium]|nr:16S rRNA processing protein RimM [Deltaproteobacteria bacterium]
MPSEPKSSEGLIREIELGYISGVFGVRGEVRLHLYNEDSFLLQGVHALTLLSSAGERRAVRLSARSGAGRRVLGRIEGVGDRDQAASLQGWKLLVREDALPPLEEDEFWTWQAEGMAVFLSGQDAPIGVVTAVHSTPAGEIFAIRTEGGEAFVPSLEEFVLEIDTAQGRLVLAPDALSEL